MCLGCRSCGWCTGAGGLVHSFGRADRREKDDHRGQRWAGRGQPVYVPRIERSVLYHPQGHRIRPARGRADADAAFRLDDQRRLQPRCFRGRSRSAPHAPACRTDRPRWSLLRCARQRAPTPPPIQTESVLSYWFPVSRCRSPRSKEATRDSRSASLDCNELASSHRPSRTRVTSETVPYFPSMSATPTVPSR